MNEKVLKILEYHKIIDQLSDYASSPMGKKLCRELKPISNINEIRQMQTQTSDALARIFAKGSISFSGLYDIGGSLLRLKVGSALGIVELLQISKQLDVALRVKSYSRKDTDDDNKDSLDDMFTVIEPLSPLNNEIKRCIISEDEIADDASSCPEISAPKYPADKRTHSSTVKFYGQFSKYQFQASGQPDYDARRQILSSGQS